MKLKRLKPMVSGFKGVALSTLFGMSALCSFGQTTVQVGTQTGTTLNYPITAYYGYSYTQQIYTASDLTGAGAASGLNEITAVRFYFESGANNNSDNWTVLLGNTTKTSFNSNSDWVDINQLENCFSGTVTMLGGGNWIEVQLTTPFIWDGTSNIVVAVDENQPGYGTTNGYWQKSDLGSDRSIYYYSDGINPDPANPENAFGRNGFVPNIQFEMTPLPDCAGTPAVSNILSSNGSSLCTGDATTLSIDNAVLENGITYQWQSFNTTSSTWEDIVGETGTSYLADNLQTTADYQLVVGCALSGSSTASNPITLTVNPLPTVVVDLTEAAVCPGGTATINASGADTYTWTPASSLNTGTGATVVASPTVETSYVVTGTDLNGCSNLDTSVIIPASDVVTDLFVTPGEICTSGSMVSVDVSVMPTVAGGGSWSFRFLEEDGTTELQTWSASSTYSFIPADDSVFVIYGQAQNSACTNPLDSVAIQVVVGFGADVAVESYNCLNMGGSASLSNIFGQPEVQSVYANTFDASANLSSVTMTGSASQNQDRLELTPSQTGISGYASIDFGGNSYGGNNNFSMSFDLTTDLPINNYGTGGADGIAYSFGDDATQGSNGNGPNGRGTKLRLSFDAAGNSNQNGNQPGIYLVYGWTGNDAFGPTSTETLAYSTDVSSWKGLTDIPVEFTINGEGRASLWVNGTLIFEDIDMPQAYKEADVSTWNHLFSAATGGDAQRHAIANLDVESSSMVYGISAGSPTDVPTTWQTATTFDNLTPGTYHVWVSKDATAACSRNVQTIEIINTNPIVDLGSDTTLCEGDVLILDAGNVGSTYTWSNTNEVTQTISVSTSGAYVAYVTDANGCVGIGTINVDVIDAPSANTIFMQGTFPTYTFTVMNAVNAQTYDWDFGDGTNVSNAPSTVSHTYTQDGLVDVSVVLSNMCGSTTVTEQFELINTVSIDEEGVEMVKIHPNPASTNFTVTVDESVEAYMSVVAVTGAQVMETVKIDGSYTVNVDGWNAGVYFVQITTNGKSTIQKVVVR